MEGGVNEDCNSLETLLLPPPPYSERQKTYKMLTISQALFKAFGNINHLIFLIFSDMDVIIPIVQTRK